MKQANIGCYGCKYHYNWLCIKDSICTGVVPYETSLSNIGVSNYIPANSPIMPDELEINGAKYRRIDMKRKRKKTRRGAK